MELLGVRQDKAENTKWTSQILAMPDGNILELHLVLQTLTNRVTPKILVTKLSTFQDFLHSLAMPNSVYLYGI